MCVCPSDSELIPLIQYFVHVGPRQRQDSSIVIADYFSFRSFG
jgi:hypothetical protein